MQRPAFSLYDASAGSGKTFTLVKEYLSIILSAKEDDAYRHILAITFTNKAVHEMKNRIVSTLSDIAANETSKKGAQMLDQISELTKISSNSLKEKARRIIRHMIHNYAAFDISTIDKFTHRIIRTFAHDLNLPTTFEVSLDTENLLAEAVDALIARAGDDQTLTKLLVDYTMEKTDSDKSWDVSREISNTGRLILNENDRAELLHLQDKTIPEFTAIRNRIQETVKDLESQNGQLAQSALELLDNHGVNLGSFSGQYFPKHLQKIKSGERVEPKYADAESIKVNKSAADGQLIEALKPELVEMLAQIYRNNSRLSFYNALLKNLTPLSLLNSLQKELSQIQEEQNILSISEFNKLINDQIRDQPAPFIYERLGDRYRHFFIDEFQDTSVMQWQNLIPLIDNATSSQELSGEKGSVMLVGDPKQSIYRWRGGKAEQFIELGKGNHPFNNPDWKKTPLETNWRSYSQVIEFNNDFFKFTANRFEDSDYKSLYAAAAQQVNHKSGGYVQIDFLPKPETDDDDALDRTQLFLSAIWDTIQSVLAQGFGLGDIAILTRKRGEGIDIASFLTENNIRIISSETLQIANAGAVRFLIDFLKYLHNPQNVEAKADVLYFIGARQSEEVHDFIAHGLRLEEREFEAWLTQFGFRGSLSGLRKKSLYETVETLVSSFLKSAQNAYVQHFLDVVLEKETKANSGISDFLDFWEKSGDKFSVPTPPADNAIQIMTIHKSKGLEFPVVIFPFADEEYNRKPKDKLWLDAEESDLGLSRVLIDNTKAVEGFGEAASAFYLQRKQEELLDNINVLYVALTRAEEQLFVISSMKLKKDGEPIADSMTELFVNYLQSIGQFDAQKPRYSFGDPIRCSNESESGQKPKTIQSVASPLDFSTIRIARREAIMWDTNQQKAIEYGNLIHQIMSGIATVDDVESALETAIENGSISVNDKPIIEETLFGIASHPELTDHFSSQNRVLTERAILQPRGATIKPDRLAVNGNDVYLLDYKTGDAKPEHVAQVEAYAQGLIELGFSVVKKTLVYIGNPVNVVHL